MAAGATRVAVTGTGCVSPAGATAADTIDAVWAAKGTAAGPLDELDGLETDFAALCPPGVTDGLRRELRRRLDRSVQLALVAAGEALDASGLAPEQRAGAATVVGTGIAGIATVLAQLELDGRGERLSPYTVPMIMPNAAAAEVSLQWGLGGPSLSPTSACATGAHAVMLGASLIRSGQAEVAVVGGAEAPITRISIKAFGRMRALSRACASPERASRPFDADRDGFVMAEGAGVLVLESERHARARGATVIGELWGAGSTSDAHHIVMPDPTGAGAAAAIGAALADAGIGPAALRSVNAHGTSTGLNDEAEAACLRAACPGVPVSGTKGVTGHMLGAAGGVEAILALAAATSGSAPPTANLESCAVDAPVVTGEPLATGVGAVLTNSFGFGGHNACLVMGPWRD